MILSKTCFIYNSQSIKQTSKLWSKIILFKKLISLMFIYKKTKNKNKRKHFENLKKNEWNGGKKDICRGRFSFNQK